MYTERGMKLIASAMLFAGFVVGSGVGYFMAMYQVSVWAKEAFAR